MKVALLGAPGTGRTQLASRLAAELPAASIDILPDLFAPEALLGYDALLLMGLDVAGAGAAAFDAELRQHLAQAGVGYKVVYGLGEQRLANALAAIDASLAAPSPQRNWVFNCEKCSDADCEHRLFRKLLTKEDPR